MATLRIPITNVHGGALYTMQIRIGSRQVVANVQFDTGSSSLAVVPHVYDAALDAHKTPTPLFQYITYGDNSGWLGPVVHTSVTLASHGRDVTLFRAPSRSPKYRRRARFPASTASSDWPYRSQNPAFDLRHGLGLKRIKPAVTFPWPFPKRGLSPGMAAIRKASTSARPRRRSNPTSASSKSAAWCSTGSRSTCGVRRFARPRPNPKPSPAIPATAAGSSPAAARANESTAAAFRTFWSCTTSITTSS